MITQQEIRLYKIHKQIIEKGEYDKKLVEKKLEPICIWYINKYKKYWRDNLFEKMAINDVVNKMRKDSDATRNKPISKSELNELLEKFLKETNEKKVFNYFDPICGFDLDEQVNVQEFEGNDEYELDSFESNALGFHLAGTLEYLKDPSQYIP